MATPVIDKFCCGCTKDDVPLTTFMSFEAVPYNVTCIISSFISLSGCIYQIFPRWPNNLSNVNGRQNVIISTLAVADLFAALGVLLRSACWLFKEQYLGQSWNNDGRGSVLCAIFSGWIQYFYCVTFMLNICYAIDVHRTIRQKNGNKMVYQVVSWLTPAIFISIAQGVIYYPDLGCSLKLIHLIVNNVFIYLPIIGVMIANPTLYALSSRAVKDSIQVSMGRWTNQERKLMKRVTEKFFMIVVVFYVCWIPNIIGAIIMWIYQPPPSNLAVVIWFTSAIMNPQQAMLNALVYRGLQNPNNLRSNCCKSGKDTVQYEFDVADYVFRSRTNDFMESMEETTPLLRD
ncbi:GPR143 (predicted) [Pycnogonum litorale]